MARSEQREKQREKKLGGVTGKGWLPGQSGNPGGRPKKLPITEELQAVLSDPKIVRQYVLRAIAYARKGSASHFKEINDRVEGSVNQKHELTGEDGGPIEISIKVIKTNAKGAD